MKRPETVTIRIEPKPKAALDLIITEMYLKTGKTITQSEAIWYLVQLGRSDVSERVEQIVSEREKNKGE